MEAIEPIRFTIIGDVSQGAAVGMSKRRVVTNCDYLESHCAYHGIWRLATHHEGGGILALYREYTLYSDDPKFETSLFPK